MDELIPVTVPVRNGEKEPLVFHQQLCCRLRDEIKARTNQPYVHIQNYSLTAAKYFIAEVKKYPIIYVTNDNNLPCKISFTNFAWARIVTSLLGDVIETNVQKQYWEKSFRELWDWMRWEFEKDMRQRSGQAIHIRSVAYSWLSHLKFLEPYIVWRDTSEINTAMNPDINIHMKSFASQSTNNAEAPATYWVNHPEEPIETKDIYISICIRNPIDLWLNSGCQEQSGGLGGELTSSNGFIQDLLYHVDYTDILSTQSNTPSSPTSSLYLQPLLPFADVAFQDCTIEETNTLPLPKSGQISIDEDFDYIMSLLPLLKKFQPEENSKVKVMLIKAMTEDF